MECLLLVYAVFISKTSMFVPVPFTREKLSETSLYEISSNFPPFLRLAKNLYRV